MRDGRSKLTSAMGVGLRCCNDGRVQRPVPS